MTDRDHHAAEINRRLKEKGFEPGELQAALRGLSGDGLAPFTTDEMELGLLDAFSNMGGATVWCGDGSSCAVQIVEHQIALAESASTGTEEEIERLKAENASLLDWKAKAMLRLIELEPVHDELAAAEQRAEAAEKRSTDLEVALRRIADKEAPRENGAIMSYCPGCSTFYQHGTDAHTQPCTYAIARAALHDEERSAAQGEEK